MLKTPREWAHLSLELVTIGLAIRLLVPEAFWISLVFWGMSVISGVVTFIKNGRILPTTAQMLGRNNGKLGLLGFIEVYLALVPAITAVAMLIYIFLVRK